MKELLLAKAIVVPGKDTLGEEYSKSYHADSDMYIFESIAYYDTVTGSFDGVRVMHNIIQREFNVPDLPSSKLNYITVDISSIESKQTHLTSNRRCCPLSDNQILYLKNLYQVSVN